MSQVLHNANQFEAMVQENVNSELLYKEMSVAERKREKKRVAGRLRAEEKNKKEAREKEAERRWQAYQQKKYQEELNRFRAEGIMRRVIRRLTEQDLSDAVLSFRELFVSDQSAARRAALRRMEAKRVAKKPSVYKNADKNDRSRAVVGARGLEMAEDWTVTEEVNAAQVSPHFCLRF